MFALTLARVVIGVVTTCLEGKSRQMRSRAKLLMETEESLAGRVFTRRGSWVSHTTKSCAFESKRRQDPPVGVSEH